MPRCVTSPLGTTGTGRLAPATTRLPAWACPTSPIFSRHCATSATRGALGKCRAAALPARPPFLHGSAIARRLGLKVKPNRISVEEIDGGSGPPSDASGSDETTLESSSPAALRRRRRSLSTKPPTPVRTRGHVRRCHRQQPRGVALDQLAPVGAV